MGARGVVVLEQQPVRRGDPVDQQREGHRRFGDHQPAVRRNNRSVEGERHLDRADVVGGGGSRRGTVTDDHVGQAGERGAG
ncbi:MAG: hypothetical protein ACK56F_28550, partial [bacterium]